MLQPPPFPPPSQIKGNSCKYTTFLGKFCLFVYLQEYPNLSNPSGAWRFPFFCAQPILTAVPSGKSATRTSKYHFPRIGYYRGYIDCLLRKKKNKNKFRSAQANTTSGEKWLYKGGGGEKWFFENQCLRELCDVIRTDCLCTVYINYLMKVNLIPFLTPCVALAVQ